MCFICLLFHKNVSERQRLTKCRDLFTYIKNNLDKVETVIKACRLYFKVFNDRSSKTTLAKMEASVEPILL